MCSTFMSALKLLMDVLMTDLFLYVKISSTNGVRVKHDKNCNAMLSE